MSYGSDPFERALRIVAREVSLRERARRLELIPGHRAETAHLFELASALRVERLRILFESGVLEE